MLTLLIPTAMMIPMTMLLKPKTLFPTSTCYSFLLAVLSLTWFKQNFDLKPQMDQNLNVDFISSPLIALSYWLVPLSLLASQKSMALEPETNQRTFITTTFTLQTFISLTFSTSNLMAFFIMFEATLIPTLIIITRWGQQQERLTAGTYFMLYTIMTSMPLLIAILHITHTASTATLLLPMKLIQPPASLMLWLACLAAFLTKLPMYGVHLWLPKAHVEAPIAGSMILAAILLKLGGYGMIRMAQTLPPMETNSTTPILALSIWGMMMASLTCLQQTDLKSLIAYSSIGHMGLVIGAILTQSPTSMTGATTLMIAHGFSSSALFCLANINYERTHTRTMTLTQGLQSILPLTTTWWLATSLMNIAMPPTINFTGELLIISALYNWAPPMIIPLGLSTMITATYTLHMYLSTQAGKPQTNLKLNKPSHTREHLLMTLHILPLLLISMKPNLVM
uniref:NADH-ubiquinone oxidoreductase chain 4 n=1 Tax=Rena humilis TaxID=711330 RepID=Q6I7X8_RENHU|nr:NADH dehydrogenase subunit 4 [Rena humilis]BAD24746.1 NADH dehydrogenase subunit 4 [Rena humilis]